MSFLNFLGDMKGYMPSVGDIAKLILFGNLNSRDTPLRRAQTTINQQQATTEGAMEQAFNVSREGADWYKKDDAPIIYPKDLLEPGNEAYVLFMMKEPVFRDEKVLKRIALYMPPSIRVNYGANWSDVDLLVTKNDAAALKGGVEQFTYNLPANIARYQSGENLALPDISAEGALMKTATYAGRAVTKTALSNSIGQSAFAVAGKTLNPMAGLAFQNVNFREFSFTFELLARSDKESSEIKNIINLFKYGMHPGSANINLGNQTADEVANSVFLDYPKTFDIFLLTPSTEYMFQIQRSVLTSIDVDYNGSGVSSFFKKTGAPVDVRLTLNFKETELLTRERIVDGY